MSPRKLAALIAFLSIGANAQWLNYPTPGTPRTADGMPNLTARTPRALDGKPDLTGVWMHEPTTVAEVRRLFGKSFDNSIALATPGMEIGTQHKYAFDILLDYKPEAAMLQPAAVEIMRRNAAARDPSNVCTGVFGFPLAGLLSEPIKIVQARRLTMILYEAGNMHRQIYTDGRVLPKEVNLPAYTGYSAGHWERDTLVVETAGFNDKTFLDAMGHPHSEGLHVAERFRRLDFGHLDVEMTFDDPQIYTKPFTIKIPHYLMPNADIFEDSCDNEKDRAHLKKQ
jgi:hypothetical protein